MNNPLRPKAKVRVMTHYVGTKLGYDVEVYDATDGDLSDSVAVARFKTYAQAQSVCDALQAALLAVVGNKSAQRRKNQAKPRGDKP